MADTGKQSPLGINAIGSLLVNQGLAINPVAESYMGSSKTNTGYVPGKCVTDTCLNSLTYAINDGYLRGPGNSNATLTNTTYNNLISIGASSLGALGNSKPPTYIAVDPSGNWTTNAVAYGARQGITRDGTNPPYPGPATSGYGNYDAAALPGYSDPLQGNGVIDQKQNATWIPYDTTNPNKSVTQWGYIRLHALQAWNEFNWNGSEVNAVNSSYTEFCSSLLSSASYIAYNNQIIMATHNSQTFLDGVYSNMDDLISSDVAGVSLATREFGEDLINLGNLIDLSALDSLGLPSLLLKTLAANNAVIQDLVLALLASGLDSNIISAATSGEEFFPDDTQETYIYSAFLIIAGENLEAILATLQCKTQGLETLADLLDVKKLFPNSYDTLTVPKYNSELGLPTNSKTYYPIYVDGGVNEALSSPEMNEYVGIQIPQGPSPTYDFTLSEENITVPESGFGSYLYGILPQDQAIAIGALAFSLRQINKIEQVDFQQFAKVVKSIETTVGLPLTNGTSKPTDQASINNSIDKQALGTGPYGTYTMSDLFGCMSGLPYPWENLYDRIIELETPNLYSIYDSLYLAVTWEGAVLAYTLDSNSPSDYFISTISIVNPGGGYGRGDAVAPTISLPYGASATCTIGTDPADIGTYGRLTGVTLVSGGSHSNSSGWYANIEFPPTATLGGTNTVSGTVGWPNPMNSVVQNYIDLANNEIQLIADNNPAKTQLLTTYWNMMGSQLAIEQRTRYNALSIVSVPKDPFSNPYPESINIFVDSIPELAQDTKPHMSAQTLEAIADLSTVGGQSIVAMMRQERNQRRLQQAGISIDNNIPIDMSDIDLKTLTTNGTLPAGVNNSVPSPLINLVRSEDPELINEVEGYTNPAWHTNELDNTIVSPKPNGLYIPTDSELIGTYLPVETTKPGDITPILQGVPVPTASIEVPASLTNVPAESDIVIIQTPAQLDPSNVSDNLNSDYIGSVLLPSSYTNNAAIDKVVDCNCDCWVQ
jgi:hypothetical protein